MSNELADDPRNADRLLHDIQDLWAKNWWALALRGIFGILFGLAAFLVPTATVLTLIILFAAYMLADGVFAMIAGVRAARRHERSWPMFLEGIADLVAGAIAVAMPGLTVFILVYLFGFWAIISGVFLIAAGLQRRAGGRAWLLAVNGGLSALWGVLIIFWLITQPVIGVLAVVWWIGIYALAFGIVLLIAGFSLRRRRDELAHRSVPHTA
jgi:uncharacterized membrane protein HdeD (DUF308 family)